MTTISIKGKTSKIITNKSSIHFFPPISRQLAGQPKQRGPNLPLINHLLQLILGNTEAFPGQMRDIVSPAGLLLGGHACNTWPRRGPSQPALFKEEKRLYSGPLLNEWTSLPTTASCPQLGHQHFTACSLYVVLFMWQIIYVFNNNNNNKTNHAHDNRRNCRFCHFSLELRSHVHVIFLKRIHRKIFLFTWNMQIFDPFYKNDKI